MLKYIPVILIFVFILWFTSIKLIFDEINNYDAKYKKYINTTCIINKDTLVVLDYSRVMKTFTLSNGTKVDYNFIKTQNNE